MELEQLKKQILESHAWDRPLTEDEIMVLYQATKLVEESLKYMASFTTLGEIEKVDNSKSPSKCSSTQ